ncbi:MAG: Spy/CpxP family protein refolding chaperone [Bradyrhizobium sp.]|nr:Spy/CpxP family protein refolding chaperone [Bradyrhizobium sp.]
MRPDLVRVALSVAACLAGLSLIVGASAEPKRGGPPAAARAAAPAMARPAAPAFHPAPQRPAMAARPMPHFAAPSRHFAEPSRPAAPHIAASRPSFHRPAMVSRPVPHIAASRHPSAHATISARSPRHERQPREERMAQPANARELRAQQHQQLAQQRQRDALSRRSTERQTRIDRLQQRVQKLQAQNPQGRRAQRTLAAQQRLLQREQLSQKRDLAQQQKLGVAPAAAQHTAAANAVQAAARGRFAARFRNNADPGARIALAARLNGWAPRKAWRHHVHAAFVPWLGPVFWPYAYADIFDYTFWPAAYDDAYWAYAYDDLIDTAFWDVGSPYSAYASIDAEGNVAPNGYVEPGSAAVGASQLRERSGLSQRDLQQLCRNPDSGITAWPFAEITRTLRPTPDQRALLDQLKHAAAQAAGALKNSCSDSYALTPPDRLRAMTNRISATLEAVRMVRPALEAFYNALNDEQRARFNALGPRLPTAPEAQPQQEAKGNPENKADRCNASKSSLTSLPIERIKAVLHPTDKQQNALDHLSDATKQAVETLQAACPDEVPVTPVGRLQAMEKRLSAMLQAANQMQPALDDFYASLTVEQKARFNTLQQVAAQ